MSEALSLLRGCALAQLTARTREEVLQTLSDRVVELGYAEPSLTSSVLAREKAYPTGLATSVGTAIPHTDPEHVRTAGFAVATLAAPVEFREMGSPENIIEVSIVVLLCVTSPAAQVSALQQILSALQNERACRQLLAHRAGETFTSAVNDWILGR